MTSELIGSALDRVVNSKTFSRSRSLQNFLTFIVTHSLEPGQNLKEYRIGVDVLKRGGTFNPAENSIVRVQAHRLRAKLADYYQDEGQAEDLRIDLEPGSYKPVIRECALIATMRSIRVPGIIVDFLPLDITSSHCAAKDAAAFIYTVVSAHLDTSLRAGLRDGHLLGAPKVHVTVDFRARADASGLRLIVYLTDAGTHRIVFSRAMSKSPGCAVSELEKAGIEFAEAVRECVTALLGGNG